MSINSRGRASLSPRQSNSLCGEAANAGPGSHKYRYLPLVSLRDFLSDHPELQGAEESALMEARINHEHEEREALEQQRQGLLKKKQSLIAENKKRKDDLASLDQDLEKFIDVSGDLSIPCFCSAHSSQAAKPIQKIFEKEY